MDCNVTMYGQDMPGNQFNRAKYLGHSESNTGICESDL